MQRTGKEVAGESMSCDGHTISLLALRRRALRHLSLLLQVYIPALRLAFLVLERESEDGVAFLDRILAFGFVGLEGLVDKIECFR